MVAAHSCLVAVLAQEPVRLGGGIPLRSAIEGRARAILACGDLDK
jgi:hypothetical protein